VQKQGVSIGHQWQQADEDRDAHGRDGIETTPEGLQIVQGLGEGELRTRLDFSAESLILFLPVIGRGVEGDADRERGGVAN
jgi:hypothetical protein